ncbi:MAG: hypothetical protein M3Q15_07000 [Pseudomonadota bacterium]|nr:hypothetical protein [Pseudomonadota bacterium]
MTNQELYLARAAEARAEAAIASLTNVRDRCLRAEAAWSSMAARAGRTDAMRTKLESEKAAAREDADLIFAE